ncbi:hypothetical protein K1719_021796 [Acacia pycnantha]|nr:hypothetical protein K1719_021796 [Acacia pycnantha]
MRARSCHKKRIRRDEGLEIQTHLFLLILVLFLLSSVWPSLAAFKFGRKNSHSHIVVRIGEQDWSYIKTPYHVSIGLSPKSSTFVHMAQIQGLGVLQFVVSEPSFDPGAFQSLNAIYYFFLDDPGGFEEDTNWRMSLYSLIWIHPRYESLNSKHEKKLNLPMSCVLDSTLNQFSQI